MQRDTHSFLQPRVCMPVHNYILMKCTHRSRQMNDTDSRNCSLHKVLHLLCVYSFFPPYLCERNSHLFGPYTLCIRLDYHSLLPLSSLLSFAPLYFSPFLFLVNLSPKHNQDHQFSPSLLHLPLSLCSLRLLLFLHSLCPYSHEDSSLKTAKCTLHPQRACRLQSIDP